MQTDTSITNNDSVRCAPAWAIRFGQSATTSPAAKPVLAPATQRPVSVTAPADTPHHKLWNTPTTVARCAPKPIASASR